MYVDLSVADMPPTKAAVLWRYMDFAKYVKLLDTSCPFFPTAEKLLLNDPFEGSFPQALVSKQPSLLEHTIPENIKSNSRIRDLPKFTLVSCWHHSEHESNAMWKLYARETDGIAIKTEFGRLSDSLVSNNSDAQFFVGLVNYGIESPAIKGSIDPFFFKRRGFEHERELRILTQPKPEMEGYPDKPDLSEPLYKEGKNYQIDLKYVIQEVVLAPFAEDWFIDLVFSVTSTYGLDLKPRQSALSGSPIWDNDTKPTSDWHLK